MGLKSEIKTKVKEILDTNFGIIKVDYVPDIEDPKLIFGNKGLQFEGVVLYIDMRNSTKILSQKNRKVVAKIHMAYFHAILKIAENSDGEVRSFNGDSILVFFNGNRKETINNAVEMALKIKFILSNEDGIKNYIEKYFKVDYGIGIDFGHILCTKIGLAKRPNKKDLIWIGHAVNKSTVISDEGNSPYNIGISKVIYDNLFDELKFELSENYFGTKMNKKICERGFLEYDGNQEEYYYTNYECQID